MVDDRSCADCGEPLEEGYVMPKQGEAFFGMFWFRAPIQYVSVFGIEFPSLRFVDSQALPLQVLRCTRCGLVRMYAIEGG